MIPPRQGSSALRSVHSRRKSSGTAIAFRPSPRDNRFLVWGHHCSGREASCEINLLGEDFIVAIVGRKSSMDLTCGRVISSRTVLWAMSFCSVRHRRPSPVLSAMCDRIHLHEPTCVGQFTSHDGRHGVESSAAGTNGGLGRTHVQGSGAFSGGVVFVRASTSPSSHSSSRQPRLPAANTTTSISSVAACLIDGGPWGSARLHHHDGHIWPR